MGWGLRGRMAERMLRMDVVSVVSVVGELERDGMAPGG